MNIVLHIERLVIDGVALTPAEQRRLGPAIEAALGRLVSDVAWRDGRVPPVSPPSGPAPRRGNAAASASQAPDRLGDSIATAIFGALRR